ncbi:MAG TPA: hypothetical protein PKK06_09745 [Phycisphaerae bacterium]|nr:hypothetical protein [Phycisphaerae bacterium]HNU45583.1 hypothetical protein [Phycisphaerae bacterium]
MSVRRAVMLLGMFVGVALTVVYLRAEQARTVARTLALEARWVDLRRELWTVQTEVARLRAPEQIHERVQRFQAALVSPVEAIESRTAPHLAARTSGR